MLCMMRAYPEGSGNLEGFKELLLAEMGRFGGHSEGSFKETSAAPVTLTDTAAIPF